MKYKKYSADLFSIFLLLQHSEGFQWIYSHLKDFDWKTHKKFLHTLSSIYWPTWGCSEMDKISVAKKWTNNKDYSSRLLEYRNTPKTQIKPKTDWRVIGSPKKRTNKFVLFAFLLFTANKTNSFVHFLGECLARTNCLRFYLTFNISGKFRVKFFFGIFQEREENEILHSALGSCSLQWAQ